MWLLFRIVEHVPGVVRSFQLDPQLDAVRDKGLVDGDCALTPDGEAAIERLRAARRVRIEELLSDWEPERHDEILQIVQRLTQSLAEEPPEPAAAASHE
jgi:hypothetical protein